MNNRLRMGIALALLAAAGQAAALGLGRIEVKSRLGEPLLAEIPVISNDPAELQQLQARLASPETFRRVGLQPPAGAADLQFSLASDARGRPVIRVTSLRPVAQAQLDFLIEVDWGQGRLVREYAAVVAPANAATASVQPAIRAPQVALPDTVQRPTHAAPVAPPAPVTPVMPAPAPAAVPPATPQIAVAPLPMPAASAPAATPGPVSAPLVDAARTYGPVKRGDTLSRIATEVGLAASHTLEQAMLGLLRANPDAFIDENINFVRRGAVLRVPEAAEVAAIPQVEASNVVREQMDRWRQRARPIPQPLAAAAPEPVSTKAPVATRSTDRSAARAPVAKAPPAPTARPVERPATTPRVQPVQQARLEIVPPGNGGATATRSGASAGGEGRMLQQQLQQRDEEIAARKAEIVELKERVAELEGLQKQQASLLAMKDSELAAAQQRLAQSNNATATATPAASVQQPAAPAASVSEQRSPMPWVWGGLALLGLALLAWLFGSRRGRPGKTDASPAPRRFDPAALAAAVPAPAAVAPTQVNPRQARAFDPIDPTPEPVVTAVDPAELERVVAPSVPAWHSPRAVVTAVARGPQPPRMAGDADPAAENDATSGIESALDAALPPRPAGSPAHQLQLAQAYLDLGDRVSARDLLRSVLQGDDPAAREQAQRLLAGLD